MCIRDRINAIVSESVHAPNADLPLGTLYFRVKALGGANGCLLYTSDAADERSSVDLGGRRIIKKKTDDAIWGRQMSKTNTHQYSEK